MFVVCGSWTMPAGATMIPVSPGTGAIQAAINGAASGDTLSLASGTYDGKILINISLTIQAAPGASPAPVVKFTDANTGGSGSTPFAFQASNTTIVWDGINIIYNGNPAYGFFTNNDPVNQNVTIKNCTISDTANHGTKESGSFILSETGAGSLLTFDNVIVNLSAGAGFTYGIYQTSASTGKVEIDNSTMTLAHCAYEVVMAGNPPVGGQITINKSTIAGDGAYGLLFTWTGGSITANQSRFNMNSSSLPTGIYNYYGTGIMVFNQCVLDASNSAAVPIINGGVGGSMQFTNCALLYNSAKMGVGSALLESELGGIASFKYCTFADCAASGSAVAHGLLGLTDYQKPGAAGTLTVQDCLFDSPIAPIYIWNFGAGNAHITYTVGTNLYSINPSKDYEPGGDEANVAATGSVKIVGNPMLASDNIHLTPQSPALGRAIDIGVDVDIDNNARPLPSGTAPDLGCSEETQTIPPIPLPPIVLECDAFRIEFDGYGQPSSLFYKPLNREILDSGNSYGFEIYNDNGSAQPLDQVVTTTDGNLLFSNNDGSISILVAVNIYASHIAFRIINVQGIPYTSNAKLHFGLYTTLNGAVAGALPAIHDGQIGVGVMGLDYMSFASAATAAFTVDWSYLWHRFDKPDDPIGGFDIFVCPASETLAMAGQVEVDDNLPHPMIDGTWGKINNRIARLSSFYVSFNNPTDRDRAASYAQQSGMGILLIYPGYWNGPSPYTVNATNFPGGIDELKSFSESLNSKGILLGIHNDSASLMSNDPVYIQPIPDNRLATWTTGTLAQSVSSSATDIYFTPASGAVIPTIVSGSLYGLRPPTFDGIWDYHMIRIDNELISVKNFDTSSVPWHLSGCNRNQQGTRAASHAGSSLVRGILLAYGVPAVDPNTTLLPELADKCSNLLNYCGIYQTSFDALETIDYAGRWWALSKFEDLVYQGLDHYVTCNSSDGVIPYEWNITSKYDTGEAVICYPEVYFNIIKNNVAYAQASYDVGGMGYFYFRLDNKAWHALTPDETQWWLAKVAAMDSMYLLGACNVTNFDQHGQRDQIFALTSNWEKLRLANVLSPAQKTRMQDFFTSFRLTSSDPAAAQWQISPTKIVPAFLKTAAMTDTAGGSTTLANPYASQPLRFEVRVLPAYDYNNASNTTLLPDNSGLSVDSGLSVSENGAAWTFSATNPSGSPSNALRASRNLGSINLSSQRGVGFYMTGNGAGGYFFIELKSLYGADGVKHFTVPNNFTGRRYIEIPTDEIDDYLYLDTLLYQWTSESAGTIYTYFTYSAVLSVSFGLIGLPPGAAASVIIENPKALTENPVNLTNLHLAVDGGSLDLTGTVASGNYIVYEGGTSAQVLDPNRNALSSLPVSAVNWLKNSGSSVVTLQSASPTQPYLKILFKMLDTPFSFQNPNLHASSKAKDWMLYD